MSSLTWNGYTARVEFDADDRMLVGHIDGIKDIVGFHADTMGGLEAAFRDAVGSYDDVRAKTDEANSTI